MCHVSQIRAEDWPARHGWAIGFGSQTRDLGAQVDFTGTLTQALRDMSQSSVDIPDASSRGAKRKLESRKRLLAAARQLFITRGYHATRPQDISKAAALGHGTFYLHFKDKRACFLAFVD